MVSKMISILLIAVSVATVVGGQNSRNNTQNIPNQEKMSQTSSIREKRILDAILGSGYYDKRIRPQGTSGSTTVRVNIFLRKVDKIDDINEEFGCQINLRQKWNDKRLQYDDAEGNIKYLTLSNTDEIWTPDVFFINEKHGYVHDIVKPNDLLRIYPNGNVFYSTRLSLVFYCSMNLTNFPFDIQSCPILIASYSYTEEDMYFLWNEEDPVQVAKEIHLPKFTLIRFFTDYILRTAQSGKYDGLTLEFSLKREMNNYLVHIYVPCCMFVFISWVSFWLDRRDIIARLLVEIPNLLAISAFISWTNDSLPKVSYTKAIDIWTGTCITFVFAALLESVSVNYVYRKLDCRKYASNGSYDINLEADVEASKKDPEGIGMKSLDTTVDQNETSNTERSMGEISSNFKKFLGFFPCGKRCRQHFPTYSESIDVISRICFPVIFAIFNLCYWVTYLHTDYVNL